MKSRVSLIITTVQVYDVGDSFEEQTVGFKRDWLGLTMTNNELNVGYISVMIYIPNALKF